MFDNRDLAHDQQLFVSPQTLIPMPVIGNVRKVKRSPKDMAEMRQSVKLRGVLQSIVVRPSKDEPSKLEIISGYGRSEAANAENIPLIPVLVKIVSDDEALIMAAEENLVRTDMNIVDEIGFCKDHVSRSHGDYELAAKTLGWTVSKVKSRIQLTRCTPNVLDALAQGDIALGHATILSVLEDTIQNNTLAKIKTERIDVNALKARLSKVQVPLSSATFDTTDCMSCPSNSSAIQEDMFAENTGIQESQCSNRGCFEQKYKASLTVTKDELEERIGTVIFLTESSVERNTVSPANVGQEQFNTGCMICENRCTVLDDRIGRNANTINNQCLDRDCFNSLTEAVVAESIKANIQPDSIIEAQQTTEQIKPVPEASKLDATLTNQPTKSVKAALSNPLKEKIRSEIRACSQSVLLGNEKIVEMVKLIALNNLAGIVACKDAKLNNADAWDMDRITKEQQKAVEHFMSDTTTYDTERNILDAYRAIDPEHKHVQEVWVPTEDLLKLYTKDGLVAFAKDAGFEQWWNEQATSQKKVSFAKLGSGKKSDLINALLETGFDWGPHLPKEFKSIETI
jgi:ParB family transcriptional regulator, chromosome partitioning protein